MDSIGKVFNHSKAIDNEIKFFVNEFENGKNRNGTEKMLKCGELSSTVNSEILSNSNKIVAENLPKLHAKVLVCDEMCHKIQNYEKRTKDFIRHRQEKNEARKIELDKLEKEVVEKKTAISDEFDLNSARIKTEYQELSEQINRENSYG